MHASTEYTVDDDARRNDRTNAKKSEIFRLTGGAITKRSEMSTKITRKAGACRMRFRRYPRELYNWTIMDLFLMTRMVKTEAIEAPLHGCTSSKSTVRQDHYSKLRTVHERILPRIIGA